MKITKTLLLLSILLCKNITCFAQWSTNTAINNPIRVAPNAQYAPCITSDGSGGAIIVWIDSPIDDGIDADIYAQRIDANGVIQWAAGGVPICTAISEQPYATVMPDGNGGAIIAWTDGRGSDTDVYAQKINASGVVQWANNGVPICTAIGYNFGPFMVSDGNGGAIIAFSDRRNDPNSADIYAQSINASGIVQWATDGIVICSDPSTSFSPQIVPDGSNGAIITWHDFRNGNFDIFAQRVNPSGIVQWATDGIPICTAPGAQTSPSLTYNPNGNIIITWADARNDATSAIDIYAQCINSSGIAQWPTNGVMVCDAINNQNLPLLISDGNNGGIIVWEDLRTAANSRDVYAQRINANGSVQWAANGVALSTATDNQRYCKIISDQNGGAIITWQDDRLGNSSSDIYAQRINSNGFVQWATNGAPVSTATNIQRNPFMVSDGNGGAIITWGDNRAITNYDVYAQRINTSGTLATDMQTISNASLYVFPNPSNGLITFQSTSTIATIDIINQLGATVLKEASVNYNQKELDLTHLSNGMYFYKIISDSNTISNGKLIIAH